MDMLNVINVINFYCGVDIFIVFLVVKVFLYVIVMLVLLIGNFFIFVVVLKNCKMWMLVNFFVVNMVVVDIFIMVFYMFRMILCFFFGFEWGISGGFGYFFCKIVLII